MSTSWKLAALATLAALTIGCSETAEPSECDTVQSEGTTDLSVGAVPDCQE
jgi:hypothetical protein